MRLAQYDAFGNPTDQATDSSSQLYQAFNMPTDQTAADTAAAVQAAATDTSSQLYQAFNQPASQAPSQSLTDWAAQNGQPKPANNDTAAVAQTAATSGASFDAAKFVSALAGLVTAANATGQRAGVFYGSRVLPNGAVVTGSGGGFTYTDPSGVVTTIAANGTTTTTPAHVVGGSVGSSMLLLIALGLGLVLFSQSRSS